MKPVQGFFSYIRLSGDLRRKILLIERRALFVKQEEKFLNYELLN
jgi:hypothetical protein